MDKHFLLLPEVQEWINQNLHQNVANLALKASSFPKEWMPDILEQLQSKQKAKLNDKKVKQYVYLFDDKAKTVKKAEVTTGIQDDQYIIVKSGLFEKNNDI